MMVVGGGRQVGGGAIRDCRRRWPLEQVVRGGCQSW